MRELTVEAVLAVPEEVVDAWVVDAAHVLFVAELRVFAPGEGEVLAAAET